MEELMEQETESQVDYVRIFKTLLHRLPVIAAVTVIFGLGAYIYSQWFMTPVYSTNVKLYVNNQQGVSESAKVQSSDVATSNTLVYGYVAMMKTDRVLKEVAMNTGLGYSTTQLSSMISAAGVDETPLFVVTVRSSVPEHAQTIANVVADVAPAVIQEVVKGSSAEIVDRAKLPSKPISPKIWRVTLIGMALGFLISIVGVLLAEKFDLRIKNPSVLAEDFGLPVLASVSGDGGYDALANNIKFSFARRSCRRVAVTDAGDGAGKASISAKLAISLAASGKQVLLVDADMGRPGVNGLMGLDAAPGLSNVLVGDSELAAALKKNVRSGLDVLCAGDTPPDPTELLCCEEMKDLMTEFAENYEYIIVSSPAAAGDAESRLLSELSDGVAIAVHGRRTTADKISGAVAALENAGARLVGFIYNAEKGRDKK